MGIGLKTLAYIVIKSQLKQVITIIYNINIDFPNITIFFVPKLVLGALDFNFSLVLKIFTFFDDSYSLVFLIIHYLL